MRQFKRNTAVIPTEAPELPYGAALSRGEAPNPYPHIVLPSPTEHPTAAACAADCDTVGRNAIGISHQFLTRDVQAWAAWAACMAFWHARTPEGQRLVKVVGSLPPTSLHEELRKR